MTTRYNPAPASLNHHLLGHITNLDNATEHRLSAHLAALETTIQNALVADVPRIETIGQYLVAAGGKRVRARLLFAAAFALAGNDEQPPPSNTESPLYTLAAVVELIHMATLLHDDVVDASPMRRGQASAPVLWGNALSVLVGDFYYSRAFQYMLKVGKPRVLQVLAEATNQLSQGEVLQLVEAGNMNMSPARYMEVIGLKTAVLFKASTKLAAIYQDADDAMIEALGAYGYNLGLAFQIMNDVHDYEGEPDTVGKQLGEDIRQGHITLPLILARKQASAADRAWLDALYEVDNAAIDAAKPHAWHRLQRYVIESGALAAAKQEAAKYTDIACEHLRALPAGSYRDYLATYTQTLANRTA